MGDNVVDFSVPGWEGKDKQLQRLCLDYCKQILVGLIYETDNSVMAFHVTGVISIPF